MPRFALLDNDDTVVNIVALGKVAHMTEDHMADHGGVKLVDATPEAKVGHRYDGKTFKAPLPAPSTPPAPPSAS